MSTMPFVEPLSGLPTTRLMANLHQVCISVSTLSPLSPFLSGLCFLFVVIILVHTLTDLTHVFQVSDALTGAIRVGDILLPAVFDSACLLV